MSRCHHEVPVLDALAAHHGRGELGFSPPGFPAVPPGERITAPLLRCLRSGVAAGMNVPDPSDTGLETVRVCADRESP